MVSVNEAILRSKDSTKDYKYPSNIGKYGMLFMFTDYNYSQTRATITDDDIGKYTGSVILPLPKEGLSENSNLKVNDTDLGITGAAAADLTSKAVGGQINSFQDFVSVGGEAALTAAALPALGAALAAISSKVGASTGVAAIGAGNAIKGAGVGAGVAMNDFQSVVFDGVSLRSHTFSWTFYPEKVGDSRTINDIKKKFQAAAHPDYIVNGSNDSVASRVLFSYPQMVLPMILIGNDAEYYYQFKPCLIKKVGISYKGDSGMSLMTGGAPASVDLQIELIETSIWTSSDYGRQGSSKAGDIINGLASQATDFLTGKTNITGPQ